MNLEPDDRKDELSTCLHDKRSRSDVHRHAVAARAGPNVAIETMHVNTTCLRHVSTLVIVDVDVDVRAPGARSATQFVTEGRKELLQPQQVSLLCLRALFLLAFND